MTWWNVIDSVGHFNHLMLVAVVLFAIFTALFLQLTRKSAHRLSDLLREQDAQARRRIKNVETVAGDIRKELLTTQQNQDIAEQQLRSKDLELDKLRKALEESRQRQEAAEERLKEQPRQTIEDSAPQAEANSEIRKKKLGLDLEQREQLMALLEPGTKGELDIIAVLGDQRSETLAGEFEEIFIADGWKTNGVIQSAFTKEPQGLVLSVHSKETAPSYANFLQRSFATIDFPVSAAINKKNREWSLTLIVGKLDG